MTESLPLGSRSSISIRIGRVLSLHKTYCGCFVTGVGGGGGGGGVEKSIGMRNLIAHHHIITSV